MINEDTEEGAIDGSFKVGVGEKNVRRFSAQLHGDALNGFGSRLEDDFSDRNAASEGDFINVGMRDQWSAGSLAVAGDDVYGAGRQANLFEPVRDFERGERRLL